MSTLNNFIKIKTTKPEFIVIGDTHFCEKSPSCRIDNYSETCLRKLEFVLDYCIDNQIQVAVMEGDFFHKQQIPVPYLTKIIRTINEKKTQYHLKHQKDLIIATIIGNHDLPFENYKFIEKSPIYLMFETGALTHFRFIEIKSDNAIINISGFDYAKEIEKATAENECCVAHCFYGFDFVKAIAEEEPTRDRITEEQAKDLGYKVYFLGHDHNFYDIANKGSYFVVRSGSLLRNSSHIQQIKRLPCFYHVKYYNGEYEFEKITVNAEAGETVFTKQSLEKPKKPELDDSVKQKISDIIAQLSEDIKEENSVTEILDNIIKEKNIDSEVRDVLMRYFSRENII